METNENVHPWQALGLGLAPFRCVAVTVKKYQACHGAPILPGGTCDACGMGIMYVYAIVSADGKNFGVGCDCVRKTGWDPDMVRRTKELRRELARAERAAAREAGIEEKRAANRAARAAAVAEMHAANPGLAAALGTDHPIVRDISERAAHWPLSERQIALVLRIAADVAERATETLVPAPTGRVKVSGKVVSVKASEGDYGTQYRMTVKVRTPEGGTWLCNGTIPADMLRATWDRPDTGSARGFEHLRGATVEFVATLTPGRDAHFAFAKRPSKSRVIAWP